MPSIKPLEIKGYLIKGGTIFCQWNEFVPLHHLGIYTLLHTLYNEQVLIHIHQTRCLPLKKKLLHTLITLLVIWAGTDLSLWFNEHVTVTNHLYRVFSGAPLVHMEGQVLSYHGRDTYNSASYTPYAKSTEDLQLFKLKDIPDQQVPPYVFTVQENQVYKFSVPNAPFGMR